MVREKQVSQRISYMETNFFNDINELIYRTETDSHILETNSWLLKGKCEEQEKVGSLGLTSTHCGFPYGTAGKKSVMQETPEKQD